MMHTTDFVKKKKAKPAILRKADLTSVELKCIADLFTSWRERPGDLC